MSPNRPASVLDSGQHYLATEGLLQRRNHPEAVAIQFLMLART